jgi:protein tyrosine/serine phosphatase
VHCQHGADRTGMMTAIYRIAMEGWSKDDAITEMTEGGYGFHAIWKDLVEYVRELDVERLKREAGVSPAPAKPQ